MKFDVWNVFNNIHLFYYDAQFGWNILNNMAKKNATN